MKPPLACRNCSSRKKKCDRAFPICSHCLKTRTRCSYRIANQLEQPRSKQALPFSSYVKINESSQSCITAAIFLNFPLLSHPHFSPSVTEIVLGPELRSYVIEDDQLQKHIKMFVDTFDSEMPFVPRALLHEKLASPASALPGDHLLLLACIKMLTNAPNNDEPRTKYYLAIKSAFLGAEINGVLTVSQLQALVLVLFYEYGHGIYPCAYTTLGSCIRYLLALGIDDDKLWIGQPRSWIGKEMCRRLWWVIYVMERVMALGCPTRPLSLRQPDSTRILPSDDSCWDQERPPPSESDLNITSPALSDMGNFRLLIHASYLLEKVIQYVADQNGQEREQLEQLHRTVSALATVLEVELQSGLSTVRSARSILNSTILLLYSESDPIAAGFKDDEISQQPCHLAAALFLDRSRTFLKGDLGDVDIVSPFLIHWGYQTFLYFYNLYQHQGHASHYRALKDLETTLMITHKRWNLSGVYASLLSLGQ